MRQGQKPAITLHIQRVFVNGRVGRNADWQGLWAGSDHVIKRGNARCQRRGNEGDEGNGSQRMTDERTFRPSQPREMVTRGIDLRPRFLLRGLLLSVGAGLFLGVLGPYGSYQNPGTFDRVAYWIASIMAGLVLYAGPFLLLRRVGMKRRGVSYWVGILAGVGLLSLVQTLITRDLAVAIWPDVAPRLPGWGVWYLQVLAIALPVVLLVLLRQYRRDGRSLTPENYPLPGGEEYVQDPAVSFVELDAGGGLKIDDTFPPPDRIDALQMEDHYIRCHLSAGSRMVHGVFRDALARQSGCDGLQVHRSWWVARRAVVRWEGTPRSLRLHLCNGLVVPVARAQVAHLREAGWLGALPAVDADSVKQSAPH